MAYSTTKQCVPIFLCAASARPGSHSFAVLQGYPSPTLNQPNTTHKVTSSETSTSSTKVFGHACAFLCWYLDFTLSCSTSMAFSPLGFVAIESSSFLLYWSSSISSINILVAIHLCGMHSLSSSNTSRCSNRGQLSKAYHQMVPCFVHTVNMFSAKRNLCCLHHEGTQNV